MRNAVSSIQAHPLKSISIITNPMIRARRGFSSTQVFMDFVKSYSLIQSPQEFVTVAIAPFRCATQIEVVVAINSILDQDVSNAAVGSVPLAAVPLIA